MENIITAATNNILSPCFIEHKRPVTESNQAEMLMDCKINY